MDNVKGFNVDFLKQALESDTELKKKLTSIAREKEVDELKKLMYKTSNDQDNEVYGRPNDPSKMKTYQKFIPYGGGVNNYKYNNMENEVYYYRDNKKWLQQPIWTVWSLSISQLYSFPWKINLSSVLLKALHSRHCEAFITTVH